MGKLMIGRTETRTLIKKVVLIVLPYTNKDNTGRGIDRYLPIVHKSFAKHGLNLSTCSELIFLFIPVNATI